MRASKTITFKVGESMAKRLGEKRNVSRYLRKLVSEDMLKRRRSQTMEGEAL